MNVRRRVLALLITCGICAAVLSIWWGRRSSPTVAGLVVNEADAHGQQYRVATVDLSQATLRTI